MKILDIKQRSQEWLDLRLTKITATDASIINGTNTFNGNSPQKLWQKKMGLIDPEPVNDKMIEGQALEIEAREWFNNKSGIDFKPIVALSDDHPYLMASLDGYADNELYIVEYKCGVKAYEQAELKFIPPYYFDQMQHSMFVTGIHCCQYVVYRPGKEGIVIPVPFDKEYFDKVLAKEIEFYTHMQNKTIPTQITKTQQEYNDQELNNLALLAEEAQQKVKEAKNWYNELRVKLIDQTHAEVNIFTEANIKLEQIQAKGKIDYPQLCADNNISSIDQEKYRKPFTYSYKLSKIKNTK